MPQEYLIQGETLIAIADAIRSKTGSSDTLSLEDMPSVIGGIQLPTLTNEGSASDLLSGKQLIDQEGKIVDGIFTIDNELAAQDNLISQIQTALQNKAMGNVNIDEELIVQDNLIAKIQTALNNKFNNI